MFTFAVFSALTALLLSKDASAQNYSTVNLTGVDLSSLPDNTLFTRWRPTSHFMAPHSWMNDPCGPSYDPSTGLYHLLYQYNPASIAWGNISWGHATSQDLVTWTDVDGWEGDDAVAIAPGPNGTIDDQGVWTGSVQFLPLNGSYGLPMNATASPQANSTFMLAFYTAVQQLQTQALAISYDGGHTFSKFEGDGINPVIPLPPPTVTEFRDPSYKPWPLMDEILEVDEPHFYTVFGSSLNDVGPQLQFYTAPASNLTHWTYLGPLFSAQDNAAWSETFSGLYGDGFEVPSTFSLPELTKNGGNGVTIHNFVMMGLYGGNTFLHPSSQWPLWSEVDVVHTPNGR